MDGNHPKRRKDKDNPYTIYRTENGQYVSFKDGQGGLHNLKIDKPLYLLFDRFELEDKSYLNYFDRYITHRDIWILHLKMLSMQKKNPQRYWPKQRSRSIMKYP